MKILQICPRVPFPPHDGGAIAMYDVACNLNAAGHHVTVLAINTPKHLQPDTVMQEVANLKTVFVDTTLSPVKAFAALFQEIPYNLQRFISKDFEAALVTLLQEQTFDVIQLEGLFVAYYVDIIRQHTQAPVILRSHNVEYLIWERLAFNEKNPLKKLYLQHLARGVKKFEQKYINKFDAIAAITEQDKKRLIELGCTKRIEFIPAGVERNRFRKDPAITPKPKSLFILSSLNWMPNLEGLQWFLDNVWLVVSRQLPDLELHVAGKDPPEALLNLKMPNVFVHGFVPSASDFMQQYEVMLVPLLSGSGMRVKIIEGMALGKCIICTGIGSEGISCENDENILICDEPDEWIERIHRYYQGDLCFAEVGQRAEKLIDEVYDNKIIIQRFIKLYQSVNRQVFALE